MVQNCHRECKGACVHVIWRFISECRAADGNLFGGFHSKNQRDFCFQDKGEASCLQTFLLLPLGNPVICILDVNSCKSALIFQMKFDH